MKKTVLFIQSNADFFNSISAIMKNENLIAKLCANYTDFLSRYSDIYPDAVITDSIITVEKIREWSDIPIVLISDKSDETESVSAFNKGIDEYILKSTPHEIILARIKNVLCHKRIPDTSETYLCDELEINFEKRTVISSGKTVHLTPVEYSIVELLCQHRGSVLTYDYILKKIWGPYISQDNKILRVNMTNIRKKIEPDSKNPKYFYTENGIGYSIK